MRTGAMLVMVAVALLSRALYAQDSTITIDMPRMLEATGAGFTFSLVERQFGSRCFTESGQNKGHGTWARANSDALNGFLTSVCRHTGFGTKRLQNGWTVSSVSTSQSCQFNDWGTWRTLAAAECTITRRTTPTVGSTSVFFEADVTVKGSAGQERLARPSWTIRIRGPAGKSPWFAQTPSRPTLLSPATDNRVITGNSNFSWTAAATGATHYRLCISRESFTGGCEERARVNVASATNVTVPFRGERVKWWVEACNSLGCTRSLETRRIINVLPAATLVSPAEGATTADRKPTFQWQLVPGAQTFELYVYRSNPTQEFRIPNLSNNVTQFTPATDLTLTSPMYWMVKACTVATGCGTPMSPQQLRSLNLPPSFSFAADLAPTLRHERCVNCHAVAATNFARVTPGLGSGHPSVASTTNCQSCHTDALLPTQGTFNPGWHAAPAAMDLRNLTDAQLCARAQNPGIAGTIQNHLMQDKLILWAIGNPVLPNGTVRPTAPPNNISTWQTRVQNWINAGALCD
ncbi:hypothetical protein BH24GEM1_BH24GEM1_18480 [soil metagenome]